MSGRGVDNGSCESGNESGSNRILYGRVWLN